MEPTSSGEAAFKWLWPAHRYHLSMTDVSTDLDPSDRELIEVASALIERHSDDFIHTVAAAIRDSDGSIHTGLNLYHFTGGPCAELVALANARAAGARTLVTIVAVGNNNRGVVAPCGRDRQVLADYHAGIRVLLPTDQGVQAASVEEVLPFAFRRES
jgi:cytidine deaminase